MNSWRAGLLVPGAALLLALGGCGKKKPGPPPEFADRYKKPLGDSKVTGKVSYRGKPLKAGAVAFMGSQGLHGFGIISPDGKFTASGLPEGDTQVFVMMNLEDFNQITQVMGGQQGGSPGGGQRGQPGGGPGGPQGGQRPDPALMGFQKLSKEEQKRHQEVHDGYGMKGSHKNKVLYSVGAGEQTKDFDLK